MAQRPRVRTPSSSSSTTDSSYSASSSCDEPPDEEKRAVVFAFDGRAESISLPWRDGNELHQRISNRFEMAIDMIESVVYVHHRPEDLERLGLQCLLLQRASERRPSPFMRLGLLDTDIYVEQEVMPSAFRREVVWLPHVTTRTSLLRIWGLEQLCRQHAALCRIWHNRQIIPSESTQSFRIEDGDYLRIFMGEEDQIACPFPGEDAAMLIQLPKLTMRSSTECHRTPRIATTNTARARHRRPGPYPRRHEGDENDEEELSRFRQLWQRPHLRGQGLQNEPVMLFDTWFLSGIRLPRCAYSRTVALPAAVHLWRDRLQQVWRDRVRPQDDLQIIHVHPDPIGSSPGGHLLLLQHVRPTEAGVILSQFNNPYRRNPNNRFAQMVPRALAFDELLWLMDLETTCPRRDYECTAYHGTTHIPSREVWQAINGQHLEVYVRQVAEWVSDDMELVQISAEPVKKTGTPSQHGLELPGDASECSRFQLNAAAARFTPRQWNIFAASEFVQDLHAEWQSAAFAWEQEEPSCLVDVWFVDHHWPWPHGFSSKQVRLYEDYSTWENSILQVWREFLVPGAPYELSIVYPHPPNLLSACHVVVVQHPRDGHVTSLVSILNDDQDGLLLHQSAITTHEHILLDDLLVVAGRHAHCIGPAPSHLCQAWFQQLPLLPGRPIMGRTGYGTVIRMRAISTDRTFPLTSSLNGRTRLQLAKLLFPVDETTTVQAWQIKGERLTAGTVAHVQRPPSECEAFPAIGEECPDDWGPENHSTIVRVFADPNSVWQGILPSFVELPCSFSLEQATTEMLAWGFSCNPFHCGAHDAIFVDHADQHGAGDILFVYCSVNADSPTGIFVQHAATLLSELEHMKVLHRHDFTKGVIKLQEEWRTGLVCVHFDDVQPRQEPHSSTRTTFIADSTENSMARSTARGQLP